MLSCSVGRMEDSPPSPVMPALVVPGLPHTLAHQAQLPIKQANLTVVQVPKAHRFLTELQNYDMARFWSNGFLEQNYMAGFFYQCVLSHTLQAGG